jgi:site-specific recombinase XerD
MAADLKIAGYSPSTAQIYLIYAGKYIDHFGRPPQQLGADHIRNYLLYLIEVCEVSHGTLRQARAALKFLYAVTLGKPQAIDWLPPARKVSTLPEILSGTEVEALLGAVRHVMFRTMMMLMYSAGLRNVETCRLMPQDIDSKRMSIHVRRGKGGIDRYTILSRRMLGQLRFYWQHHRPHLDGYLFPSGTKGRHVCTQTVRNVFRAARKDAGITKKATPHTLRHSFATHLLECGYDITVVQALLGHRQLRTTQRYVHLPSDHLVKTCSPLDILGTDRAAVLG